MTPARDEIDGIFRKESRRAFATLVRMLRDFDLAEEMLQEAFASALESWPSSGIPANPRAWLISTAKFKAIDTMRRRRRFDGAKESVASRFDVIALANVIRADRDIEDERLRLIFACCHPALDPGVQVALTLREVCGLETDDIARAFLSNPATMAQRLVRGKAKIRTAGIPFDVPEAPEFPERLDSVLAVIYLVYSEGYSPSSGDSLVRVELSVEAIRLGRLLVDLLPDPESLGLLALMLLQESRRAARMSPSGDLVLLEDQDRSRWDREMIAEGQKLIERALVGHSIGAYAVQAAIAAVHIEAKSSAETDWPQLAALYDTLLVIDPSPVVELNRAVVIAMRDGPATGLAIIDELLARGSLADYHLAHAARADLCRRLGQISAARESYERAISLAKQDPERRFLQDRLSRL